MIGPEEKDSSSEGSECPLHWPCPTPYPALLLTSSTIFLPWGTVWRKLWITWSCSMGNGLVFGGTALTRKEAVA